MENLINTTESAYGYPLLIKQLFLAPMADNPEQEIVFENTITITYRTWKERVHRLANALASVGVKAGDTVAVMDWDSNRYLEAYYAIPMMGAVMHTINVRLSAEQLAYTIEHAEDDVIICHSDFIPLLESIKGRIQQGRKFILIREDLSEFSTQLDISGEYEEMLASAEPWFDFQDFDEDTRATIFYTTGTTGLPKGVYFSHRQLVIHTLAGALALSSPFTQGRLHQESVYMPITPMFHVHAWGVPYIATFLGIKQVYPGKYVPAKLLELIAKHKVTFSHCVPTILNMLLNDPSSHDVDLSEWICVIGGSALPKTIALEALNRGIDVMVGYGMSETCPIIALSQLSRKELELSKEEQVNLRCRTGRAVGLAQIRVVDETGKDVMPDDKSTGEIILRAPYLTQGYHKDHVHSENLWEGGWMHTNDVACIDESRSLRITDRTKDVIKVSGEWLSSVEIEDVISRHEGVAEVAVIGLPDENWGEIPLALVVPTENSDFNERELKELVKTSVDSGVLPREAITLKIKRVSGIPKTSVGKINKVALRTEHVQS